MASPPSQRPFQQNLPHLVQEKISLVSTFEELIESLKSQLKNAEEEYARLQADIEPYRVPEYVETLAAKRKTIHNNPKGTKSPISRCPNEILYLIFQQYILPRHRSIGRLLFVCKRWKSIVETSPSLWAKIQVFDGLDFFRDSRRTGLLSFLRACMTRSRGLLLDVHLDLGTLPHHSEYIASQLEERAMLLVDEDDWDEITDQITDNSWDFRPFEYDSLFNEFAGCIFGAHRQHMKRWATLDFRWPYAGEAAKRLWWYFSKGAPYLKEVTIRGVPGEVIPLAAFNHPSFPSAEKVTILQFPHIPVPLDIIEFNVETITYLHLDFDLRLENLHLLSSFISLRSLTLQGRKMVGRSSFTRADPSKWPIYSIRLLKLTQLTLIGEYQPLKAIEFDLPTLDRLTVSCTDSMYHFPNLSPQRIRWRIEPFFGEEWTVDQVYEALNALTGFSVASITIPESAKLLAFSKGTVLGSDELGSAPRVTLYVEHEDGRIEHVSEEEAMRLFGLAKMAC